MSNDKSTQTHSTHRTSPEPEEPTMAEEALVALERIQHGDASHGSDDFDLVANALGHLPRVGHILRLAEVIREVDGNHRLGAAALAEAILAHPGFAGCHDGADASPTLQAGEGEV